MVAIWEVSPLPKVESPVQSFVLFSQVGLCHTLGPSLSERVPGLWFRLNPQGDDHVTLSVSLGEAQEKPVPATVAPSRDWVRTKDRKGRVTGFILTCLQAPRS